MLDRLDSQSRAKLLELARRTVEVGARSGETIAPAFELRDHFGDTPVATFVTVHVDGQLNGCLGTLEPRRPICQDIVYNAYQAAFHDPRFDPLTIEQLDALDVHISVLSPLESVDVGSQDELLSVLRPGHDGLVLRAGSRRATFLPSVWDKLIDPVDFVLHLKRKAQIGPREWPDDMVVFRYEVLEFSTE